MLIADEILDQILDFKLMEDVSKCHLVTTISSHLRYLHLATLSRFETFFLLKYLPITELLGLVFVVIVRKKLSK